LFAVIRSSEGIVPLSAGIQWWMKKDEASGRFFVVGDQFFDFPSIF